MYLHTLTYTAATDDTASSSIGTFKFHNENYFDVNWEDVSIGFYWMPQSNTIIAPACSGSTTDANQACEYLGGWSGQCAIKIGEFNDDSKFKTSSRETINEDLPLTQTSQQKACMANMASVALVQGVAQTLYSKGNVHAKSQFRNFHKLSIDGTYYY